jgi:hypothetical protein
LEFLADRTASKPPHFVRDPVQESLPQVRLQRASTLGLKALDPLKRSEKGVLDKILRVGRVAGPSREAPAGPALEGDEKARKQGFHGLAIASMNPFKQSERRLGPTRQRAAIRGDSPAGIVHIVRFLLKEMVMVAQPFRKRCGVVRI